jgi:polyphosphate glucokinase
MSNSSEPTAPVIGIDVGGTGIKGAPIDVTTGMLAADRLRLLTPSPSTPERVAKVVAQIVEQLDVPGPLGLTVPAVVRHGVVETAANIDKAWIGTDAVDLFGTATARAVAVVNDADAAGVAEVRFGAGAGHAGSGDGGVIIVVTLGTGIGSALFVDGVLVPNTELGHLPLHHGDAEQWAADSAREREDLSWKEWAHRLQRYFELLEDLFWPELIIVGGGVSKRSEKFLPHIDIRTALVPAKLLNNAGIVGAALVAPSLGAPSAGAPSAGAPTARGERNHDH